MIKAETETTITFDSEERLVRIFSARPPDQSKLRRAGIEPYKGTLKTGFFYKLPLNRFSWRIKRAESHPRPVSQRSLDNLRAKTSKVGVSDG